MNLNLGTNQLGSFVLDTNLWASILPPADAAPQHLNLDIVPLKLGTNIDLTLQLDKILYDSRSIENNRIVLKNYSHIGGFVVALQLVLEEGNSVIGNNSCTSRDPIDNGNNNDDMTTTKPTKKEMMIMKLG